MQSNNVYAEHLFKRLALIHNSVATRDGATQLVRDFWKQRGIDVSAFFQHDGCGMSPMWSRFLPHIIKTKALIEQGAIGEIQLLTATFCIRSENGPEHRHYNIDLCGGTILDIGIYNIFLSLLLLGRPEAVSAVAALSEQGVDTQCSYSFKYPGNKLSVMYSSFLANPGVVAEIHGTQGSVSLKHLWFCPGRVKLRDKDGNEEVFTFDIKGNGYEFEAEEVARCLNAGKTESTVWTPDDTRLLVEMMDNIRQTCGVVYPAHVVRFYREFCHLYAVAAPDRFLRQNFSSAEP